MYAYECKCNLLHGPGKEYTDSSSASKNTGTGKYFSLQDAINRFRKDVSEIKKDGFVFMNDNPFQFHRSEEIDDQVITEDIKWLGTHMTTMISREINRLVAAEHIANFEDENFSSRLKNSSSVTGFSRL